MIDNDYMNTDNSSRNKKVFIVGAVLLVLVIALVSLLVLSQRTQQSKQAVTPASTETTNTQETATNDFKPNIVSNVTQPPEVSFISWTGLDQPPGIPSSLGVYSLKQSFTNEEVKTLAQKLKADALLQKKNNIITSYTVNDDKTASVLFFNTVTGEFSYRATKGIALPEGEKIEDKAYALLRTLGWYDPTIQVAATYRNSRKPGVLYVELHRSWNSLNAPLFNPIGLLNVPEKQSLSSLTLNSNLSNTPKDSDITSTSDNRNGYLRADDFNTITLGINDATQTVTMIKSTMRPVARTTASTPLISYEQAVQKLKNGQYTFIFTSPAGVGAADWSKVYPENMARAKRAAVTETIMAYLEQSPSVSQSTLEPYYIFRGTAKLDSGYTVTFNAAVPAAVNGPLSSDISLLASVKGIFAQAVDTTQKQGTFDGGTKTSTVTPSATGEAPVDPGYCRPAASELAPVYQANGLTFGWASYTYWKTEYRNSKSGYWYYVPDSGATATIVESNLDSIIAALEKVNPKADIRDERKKIQYDIQNNIPAQQLAQDSEDASTTTETTQKQDTFYPTEVPQPTTVLNTVFINIFGPATACPVRLTGSSPTLFVYGVIGSNIRIKPPTTYTYADPAVSADGEWNIEILGTNDLKTSEVRRPYMYYEYKKVDFARPAKGWIVKKTQFEEWINDSLRTQLVLTPAESERALFELRHAAADVAGNEVFVGMIDELELSVKVPLKVNGAIVKRLHMYVGKPKGPVASPLLTPVIRSESLVLELGSHAE
ncbi:MAG: hypothetical protein RI947_609 [Candidatus Parcubacteria bacterium]|jgi:hypothetical protein